MGGEMARGMEWDIAGMGKESMCWGPQDNEIRTDMLGLLQHCTPLCRLWAKCWPQHWRMNFRGVAWVLSLVEERHFIST